MQGTRAPETAQGGGGGHQMPLQENLTSHLTGKQTRARKARQFTSGHYQGVFLLSKLTSIFAAKSL